MCTETIGRGAFDGIERRANRIRVNRDHNLERTVGRAVALHPSRDEGLVAEVRIAQTDLGEETLALAADGCLDASAGFRPMDGGLEWQGRDAYRITQGMAGAHRDDARPGLRRRQGARHPHRLARPRRARRRRIST